MILRAAHWARRVVARAARALTPAQRDRLRSLAHGLETRQVALWERKRHLFPQGPSDAEMTSLLRRNGEPGFYPYLWKQRRGQFGRRNFIPADRAAVIATLRRDHAPECGRVIAQADKVLRGEFDLLGSGPVDMRRGKAGPGHRIDWNRDPISGERYAAVFNHWRWNPYTMRRGNADVKGPWELGRCQHFPLLGQAYWLTGDERYARCYALTIADFIRRNRAGLGVQWACPMDVALRVVSWLAGLSYFQGSPSLSVRWWRVFLKSLVQHGRHITNNLEFGTLNGRIIVSNHGLANLFGLYWLALNFPGLDAGCVWRGIAESGLEQQIQLQVLEDGGGFESSVPYHRLVTEMFLSAYALGRHHGIPLSEAYRHRLAGAMTFIRTVRQPDGRTPQIGDADNGRAHILSGYGFWESEQESMDHLLAAAGAVLNCPQLSEGIAAAASWESIMWRDPSDALAARVALPPIPKAAQYPHAGVAVLRNDRGYLLMHNSACGTFGIGNHKHNDQLAIEWIFDRQPVFVDAGSYTYTRDPEARNWFRSTAHHNTLQIDAQEQHGMDPSALFRLVQQGTASWDKTRDDQDGTLALRGWCTAYARLQGAPVHERRVMLGHDGGIIIDDWVTHAHGHAQRWYFLVHPGISITLAGQKAMLTLPQGVISIEQSTTVPWRTEPAWYSPGYGVKQPTHGLVLEVDSMERVTFLARELRSADALPLEEARMQSDLIWGNALMQSVPA